MRATTCLAAVLLVSTACSAAPIAGTPPNDAAPTPPAPAAIARLIGQFRSDDWRVRELATRTLVLAGEAARDALRRAAKSPDAEVRWRARYVLSRLERGRVMAPPSLARTLYRSAALARARPDGLDVARRLYAEVVDRFPNTQWAAAAAERLAGFAPKPRDPPPALPPEAETRRLVADLNHPAWHVRQRASWRLAQLGERARTALQKAAGSADRELAWRARRLLDRLGRGPAEGDAPAAPEPEVRLDVLNRLLRDHEPREDQDIHRLVAGLASKDPDRVAAARELLLNIGDDATGPLVQALATADEVTGVEIIDVLRRITGETLGFDPERWKAWWRGEQRRRKD